MNFLFLNHNDQEPRITKDLARILHLSYNPGLIYLNIKKLEQ
jgi:hypothetical protein